MVKPSAVASWALTVALFFSPQAWGEQGIRGRAAIGGTLVERVTVSAYPYRPGGFGPLTGEAPAGQALTATDGTYEILLPPGRYVVEALQKAPRQTNARPEAGDLHCLYSGSPVSVAAGSWTPVGLNLVEVPTEKRTNAPHSGLTGHITLGGAPVERVYLYLYSDLASAFRGPAPLLQPVAAGSFQLRLPPGTYYLVARKRMRGGPYGPVEIGDLFNFYSRNPVILGEGENVSLEIPLIERLSQLEEDVGTTQGVAVRVVGHTGNPAEGYYVLAYSSPARSGPPLSASAPTDAEGLTWLPLAPGQTVHLRARKSLGGPLEPTESYADGEVLSDPGKEILLTLEAPR